MLRRGFGDQWVFVTLYNVWGMRTYSMLDGKAAVVATQKAMIDWKTFMLKEELF